MADRPSPVRSYQRIFRPDRRIYQVDGRRLPVPGGVPLVWLGWAAGTIVAAVMLDARSVVLALLLSVGVAVGAAGHGGWQAAGVAAAVAFAGAMAAGVVLGVLDWPLRFVVLPIAVATCAGHASPDGRPAHRYLLSWTGRRLRPNRCSVDRPLPREGRSELWGPWVWVAPDEHTSRLRRGRVSGPAEAEFAEPMAISTRRGTRHHHFAQPASQTRARGEVVDAVELGEDRVLEIRP